MTYRQKIIDVEGEAFLILPQEILDHLGAGVGDDLTVIDTEDGIELRLLQK